jgi:hypothetical protein
MGRRRSICTAGKLDCRLSPRSATLLRTSHLAREFECNPADTMGRGGDQSFDPARSARRLEAGHLRAPAHRRSRRIVTRRPSSGLGGGDGKLGVQPTINGRIGGNGVLIKNERRIGVAEDDPAREIDKFAYVFQFLVG